MYTELWTLPVGLVPLQVMSMDQGFYYLALKAPKAG